MVVRDDDGPGRPVVARRGYRAARGRWATRRAVGRGEVPVTAAARDATDRSSGGSVRGVSPSATVRPLRPDDHRPWAVLWQGYLAHYRAGLPSQVTAETFRRLCAGGDLFGLLACDGEGRPVGLAHALLHPSTWSTGGSCYLEDLFVAPDARGGDAGRLLVEAVASEARARGAEKLYWHTQAYNGRARSLYDQVGALSSMVVYQRELPR